VQWDELNPEQQCVLLCAAEGASLLEVLAEWRNPPGWPATEWPEVISYIKALSPAALQLVEWELVELFFGNGYPSTETCLVPSVDAQRVLYEAANWWTDLGHPINTVDLVATAKGIAVFATHTRDNLYAFRKA
jgi:hypothetical protein